MAIAADLSTELLGRILDTLNVGVVFVDSQNTIRVFNTAASVMLGEDPNARIGSSLLLCHAAGSVPGVLRRIDDLSSGRVPMTQNWLDYQGRVLREYILPVLDANGEPAGTLLLVHDASAHVDCLKRLGEWTDVRVSGLGEQAPRDAGSVPALAQPAHAAEPEPDVRPGDAEAERRTDSDGPATGGKR